jgi:shikimate dehydrogenase
VFLLGHHISYSASPAMQSAAFAAAGLHGWSYELLDVPAAGLPDAVEGLRAADVAGANVTIPHKVAAARLLDELDESARSTGAANTIANRDGRLMGSNTDVAGIRASLTDLGVQVTPALRALVLGSGGSARAALAALAGARVAVAARRPEAAPAEPAVGWEERRELAADSDLVVNCTPLGRAGEEVLDEADLPPAGAVLDLVYVAGGTPLVRAARHRGLRVADGWEVLLEQGASAFTAWTGLPAPRDAMREALPA